MTQLRLVDNQELVPEKGSPRLGIFTILAFSVAFWGGVAWFFLR